MRDDSKFASLSKFNSEARELFDSGVFHHFTGFQHFLFLFPSLAQLNGPLCPCPSVVWTSLGHYLGGYQDRLLGGPLRLLGLCHTAPDDVGRKDYDGKVLG
jgi:hypothetical protein